MECSLIIIHADRSENLRRTLRGIEMQDSRPSEVIIIDMGEPIILTRDYPFTVRIEYLKKTRKGSIPLAAARNFGASLARNPGLLFLDVDCIPATDYVRSMQDALKTTHGIVMGTPRYLLRPNVAFSDTKTLYEQSVPHPARPEVDSLTSWDDYAIFWSLCFSVRKTTFLKDMKGFDENFKGYGAEDTDFAFMARASKIPFYISPATVFHQQHPIYDPPLNHLNDIMENCNAFFKKWGLWPMESELKTFSDMGYIKWSPNLKIPIQLIRLPKSYEIERRLLHNAPYR